MFHILLLIHILGVVIGLGAAFTSDFLFFRFARDRKVSTIEKNILEHVSKLVWIGVTIFTISGIGLILTNPHKYLTNPTFLLKMIVVLVIVVNGTILGKIVSPRMREFKLSKEVTKKEESMRNLAFVCGFISIFSWTSALFIAVTKGMGLSAVFLMSSYFGILVFGSLIAFFVDDFIIKYLDGKKN